MILLSAAILNDLFAALREHIYCLYNLVEVVANCDLLSTIALHASQTNAGLCVCVFVSDRGRVNRESCFL